MENESKNKNNNMRVLFIAHCETLYGANRSLLGLIEGLKAHGVESSVACPKHGPFTEELSKQKIVYHILPIKYWASQEKRGRWDRLWNNFIAGLKIAIWARSGKFDFIYSNSSATPTGAFAATLSFKPHIWHIREYGYLDYGLELDWGEKFFKFWLKRAAAVIFISENLKSTILSGLKFKKGKVIYNGVFSKEQLEKIKKEREIYQPKKNFIFIIMGQVDRGKNQREAVEAFELIMNKYPETKLWIVGDYRPKAGAELKKECDAKNYGERIMFFDFVQEPFKLLAQADCLLTCARYEGFGRTTVEAMAYGKPVIGFDGAGTQEIVLNGKTGLLYDGGAKNLAKNMEKLVTNPKWAYELGREGVKRAESKFMLEDYARNVYQVINNL